MIKLVFKKCCYLPSQNKSLTRDQELAVRILGQAEFGTGLSKFLKLSDKNEESIQSGLLTLINLAWDDRIRASFSSTSGINFLVAHLDRERKEFAGKLDSIRRALREDVEFGPPVVHMDEYLRAESTLIGQCLCVLTKYADCRELINSDGLNEHVMSYVRLIFEIHAVSTNVSTINNNNSNPNSHDTGSDTFEQFIGAYLTCLTHLVDESRFNKKCFLASGLLEHILKFWSEMQRQYETIATINPNAVVANGGVTNGSNKSRVGVSIGYSIGIGGSDPNTSIVDYLNRLRKESMAREQNSMSKHSSRNYNLSPQLIKTLVLVLVELMGHAIDDNDDLKKKFIYSYNAAYLSVWSNEPELAATETNSLAYSTNSFIRYHFSNLIDK